LAFKLSFSSGASEELESKGDGKMKGLNLVFLGPPGAGKGTQAQRISEKFGLVWICAGDILRQAVAQENQLGKEVQEYLKRGELVPDQIVLSLIAGRLDEVEDGFILDGFPRTLGQAKALDKLLHDRTMDLSAVIFLDVPDEEIVKRLSARRICPNCGAVYNMIYKPPKKDEKCDRCGTQLIRRRDDEPETVRNRLRVFREQTAPLIDYYKKNGLLKKVNGVGMPDQITEKIEMVLQRLPLN